MPDKEYLEKYSLVRAPNGEAVRLDSHFERCVRREASLRSMLEPESCTNLSVLRTKSTKKFARNQSMSTMRFSRNSSSTSLFSRSTSTSTAGSRTSFTYGPSSSARLDRPKWTSWMCFEA